MFDIRGAFMINTKTPRMSETSPIDRFTHVGSTALIVAALDRRGRESLVCRRSYDMEILVGVSIHSEGAKTGSAASGTHELLMVSDPPASSGPFRPGRLPGVQMAFGGGFFYISGPGPVPRGRELSVAMLTTTRAFGTPD